MAGVQLYRKQKQKLFSLKIGLTFVHEIVICGLKILAPGKT